MRCWKCKSEMPEGLKYCGNCGVHMNRAVHMFQWLFSKKGIHVLILALAVLVAAGVFLGSRLLVNAGTIDMDMGLYIPEEEDVVYLDDDQTYGYVNNMILVFATSDATDRQILKAVNHVNGEIVGVLPGIRQYQIQVSARSQEELEALCLELMEFEAVKVAVIDKVATTEQNVSSVPNDPWYDYSNMGFSSDWNEDYPDGTNWWVEATHLLSAWEYADDFSTIKVGIVDGGFELSHEDLDITVLNRALNDADDHGTHVAGIIGATHNNGMGISGAMPNVELYGVDCFESGNLIHQSNISTLLGGIDLCLSQGCRVVNMSAGIEYGYPDAAQQFAIETALYLIMMLDSYDQEFLVVQAAGNGDHDGKGVDAETYNGFFASISEEIVALVLQELDAMGVKLERNITVDDVMSSFLVVGNVDYERSGGNYQLAVSSNYGRNVTICAPGRMILSTFPGFNNYEYLNGTSMAAPVVSGIAAMVWSVDQDLTAAQVKDIILSTATEPVLPRMPADFGRYYMVNAQAAVEKALEVRGEEKDESLLDWFRNLFKWGREEEPVKEPTERPTEALIEEPTVSDERVIGSVLVEQQHYIDGSFVDSAEGITYSDLQYRIDIESDAIYSSLHTTISSSSTQYARKYYVCTLYADATEETSHWSHGNEPDASSDYIFDANGNLIQEIYTVLNDEDAYRMRRLGYDYTVPHVDAYTYDNSGNLISFRIDYEDGTFKEYACKEYRHDVYAMYHGNTLRIQFMDYTGVPGYRVEFENGYVKEISENGYILTVGIWNTDEEYRFIYGYPDA